MGVREASRETEKEETGELIGLKLTSCGQEQRYTEIKNQILLLKTKQVLKISSYR